MDSNDFKKLAKGILNTAVSENNEKKLKGYIPVKQSAGRRILNFLFEQDLKTASKSVFNSMVKPSIKALFLEAVMGTFERMVCGDNGGKRSYGRSISGSGYVRSVGDTTSYDGYYRKGSQQIAQMPEPTRKNRAYSRLKFQTRSDALAAIDFMEELIRVDGACSVSSLYDELEIAESDFTDNDTGWTSVNGYSLRFEAGSGINDPDGWILSLPNPKVLPRK